MSTKKRCSACKDSKDLSEFGIRSVSKDGRRGQCKVCRGKSQRDWEIRNIERHTSNQKEYALLHKKEKAVYDKIYREDNKEILANVSKVYYDSNKEKILRYKKQWKKDNTGLVNACNAKRRAAKLQATPPWADLKAIEEIYQDAQDIQWLAEEPLHVDHIYPLQGKTMCGLHVPENLRIISASENLKKNNRIEGV